MNWPSFVYPTRQNRGPVKAAREHEEGNMNGTGMVVGYGPRRGLFSRGIVLAAMLGAWPAAAAVDEGDKFPQITRLEPAEVPRNGVVTVTGSDLQKRKLSVWLGTRALGAPVWVAKEGTSLTFVVPREVKEGKDTSLVPLGKQPVRLQLQDEPAQLIAFAPHENGYLTVVSDTREPPKVVQVVPSVSYYDKDKFTILLSGEGFSPVASDNVLLMDEREQKVCWKEAARCEGQVKGSLSASGRELEFAGFARADYQGPHRVRIRVGDAVSEATHASFSLVPRGSPRWISGLVAGGLLALLGGLVWFGARRTAHVIDGERYGFLRMLFLDPETDTYSLSKFQFFLWTAAAVFGYAFLTISRTLIQGYLDFPDIPHNLPGIILISAGTTVAAVGVTAVRGPKGSGAVRPSIADFVTSGGVVVAERFQYLIWTLVAVGTFLLLIVLSDPADVATLPTVPEAFLYLMGISAFGYLGGKIARKPGPVIDSVAAERGGLQVEIRGRNLSPDAGFTIRDVDLVPLMGSGRENRAVVIEKDPQSPDGGFAKILKLHVRRVHPDWLLDAPPAATEAYKLTLSMTNPDGQKSEWPFEVTPDLRKHLQEQTRSATATDPQSPQSTTPAAGRGEPAGK
jgi:hypothetical protein